MATKRSALAQQMTQELFEKTLLDDVFRLTDEEIAEKYDTRPNEIPGVDSGLVKITDLSALEKRLYCAMLKAKDEHNEKGCSWETHSNMELASNLFWHVVQKEIDTEKFDGVQVVSGFELWTAESKKGMT